MLPLALEIYDGNDIQYRPGFWGLRIAKRFEKGEDHWLAFNLPYSANLDYPEIAYDNEVIARRGLTPVWIGRMRKVEQRKEAQEYMTVRCFGNWVFLDDFSYDDKGKLWVDTRYNDWEPGTDQHLAGLSPERYRMDTQDRLFIAPVKDENFGQNTNGGVLSASWRYDEVKRITFDYDIDLEASNGDWTLIVQSADDDFTNRTTLWTQTGVTTSGSQDITLGTERARLLFHLYWPNAAADYPNTTGAGVFVKITNLKVFGSTDTTVTMDDVGKDIVDQLQAGTPIENSDALIEAISRTLEPLYFERGEMCLDALKFCGSCGDANNRLIGYGVEGGGYRVYVRKPDWENVRYVINAFDAIRIHCRGALLAGKRGYLSEAWGYYKDEEGKTQYTEKYYVHVTDDGLVVNTTSTGNDLASDKWGQRSGLIPLGRVSSSLAVEIVKTTLKMRGHPIVRSSFEVIHKVKDLQRGGAEIHPLEMKTGYVVQVPHFRAAEAEGASGSDVRDLDTTFLLSGLEWDEDRGIARLFPEGAEEDERRLLAYVREMRQE